MSNLLASRACDANDMIVDTLTHNSRNPGEPFGFERLARVAPSIWFIVLAFIATCGVVDMISALPPGHASFAEWSSVISRCCTIIFFATLGWVVLIRPRPLARRKGVVPSLIAFSGTYAVWFIPFLPPGDHSPGLRIVSAIVTLGGSLAIIYAVVYLGRSFSIAPQARKLVIGGPYRLVRHPLYIAEEIAIIGVLMQYAWYASIPLLIVHLALQLRRMAYEEALLRAVFPDYEAYARRTARLIPGIW